ncbi:MAG: rhomboid family intramembrane serine protease [Ignavibacteriales bacterium]|nr:rhomboid family intramembrane serine protease [Ignavibacteriales bacterium]
MIPIRDRNPARMTPVVNIGLIIANVAVFFYSLSLGQGIERVYLEFGVVPIEVVAAFREYRYLDGILPLFTSMFLHAGWLHLGGNMLYLWIFGDNIEDRLGHAGYLGFYALCGLAAGLLHLILDPESTIPTVGASGAISGVLGAYLVMFPKARVLTVIPVFFFLQVAELPALIVLGFWFVIQFLNGLVSLGYDTAGMGGVAWWAHVGGFVAGVVLIVPMRKLLQHG